MSKAISTRDRKAKRTFTLSLEVVVFLESVRERRNAASVSSIVEDILQAARREYERSSLENSISDYYSALNNVDAREHAEWGDFATSQFISQRRA